jgi:hypothetical protein
MTRYLNEQGIEAAEVKTEFGDELETNDEIIEATTPEENSNP